MALAAVALGLGVLWAGPAVQSCAFAQDRGASAAETPPASAPPAADRVFGPDAVTTWPTDTASAVDALAVEPPSVDAPLADPAQAADAVGASTFGAEVVEAPLLQEVPAVDTSATEPLVIEQPSRIASEMADWILSSSDNGGLPFVIIDKVAADVFAFDADGRFLGAAAALVGLTPGDDATPGVGDRELSSIPPEDRTTPAGRFVAGFGSARGHRKVLWVDYATAISLHPVVTANPAELRPARLMSPVPRDHRITYGCINVPADFYREVVLKALGNGSGVVYILPDTKPLAEVFPAFSVLTQAKLVPNRPAEDQDVRPVSAGDPVVTAPEGAGEDRGSLDGPGPPPENAAGADEPSVTGSPEAGSPESGSPDTGIPETGGQVTAVR
jgi:hypothetical protein